MTLAEAFGFVSQFGVAGVFAVLWWLERDERKDAQKANGEMFERALTALVENKNTVQMLKDIFNGEKS